MDLVDKYLGEVTYKPAFIDKMHKQAKELDPKDFKKFNDLMKKKDYKGAIQILKAQWFKNPI